MEKPTTAVPHAVEDGDAQKILEKGSIISLQKIERDGTSWKNVGCPRHGTLSRNVIKNGTVAISIKKKNEVGLKIKTDKDLTSGIKKIEIDTRKNNEKSSEKWLITTEHSTYRLYQTRWQKLMMFLKKGFD